MENIIIFFLISKKLNIKHLFWRILEPILLGSAVNIAVNFFFNPKHPDFILDEFIIAIAFGFIITEVNRSIDTYLEKKLDWVADFRKRFLIHLMYLLITLLITINVFGNIYIWISGDSFHTWDEIIIINFLALLFALLLTFIKWLVHFYKNWRVTSLNLNTTTNEFRALKSSLEKTSQTIELQKGNHLFKVSLEDINLVKSELGIVYVYKHSLDRGIYKGSLNTLEKTLPEHLFFRINRNFILHRDTIKSISPSTYGKIQIHIFNTIDNTKNLTVSRPKASTFRKWYYSTSE